MEQPAWPTQQSAPMLPIAEGLFLWTRATRGREMISREWKEKEQLQRGPSVLF
jgi:hypothetical protein